MLSCHFVERADPKAQPGLLCFAARQNIFFPVEAMGHFVVEYEVYLRGQGHHPERRHAL